jgi:alcohol dehydrogenase (cytochrome c)
MPGPIYKPAGLQFLRANNLFVKQLTTHPITAPFPLTPTLSPQAGRGRVLPNPGKGYNVINGQGRDCHWRQQWDRPSDCSRTRPARGQCVGGNFYAVDAANGQKLWGQKLSGAIGGGVITYTANGVQKVAVATGFISPVWPVSIATAKIAILGVEGDTRNQ